MAKEEIAGGEWKGVFPPLDSSCSHARWRGRTSKFQKHPEAPVPQFTLNLHDCKAVLNISHSHLSVFNLYLLHFSCCALSLINPKEKRSW